MGFLQKIQRWRQKRQTGQQKSLPSAVKRKGGPIADKWQELPAYIPAESAEYTTVSVIATALAAGSAPNSSFEVKKILKRNPEAELVSVIAAAVAAGEAPNSQFIVKKIYQRRREEDAAQIQN